MEYYIEGKGVSYDNLMGGPEFPVDLRNISVSGGASFCDVLAGASGVFTKVASDGDADKILCIAAEDVDTNTQVASAYFAGKFNIGALSFGGGNAEKFVEKMRSENMILTNAKEL